MLPYETLQLIDVVGIGRVEIYLVVCPGRDGVLVIVLLLRTIEVDCHAIDVLVQILLQTLIELLSPCIVHRIVEPGVLQHPLYPHLGEVIGKGCINHVAIGDVANTITVVVGDIIVP